MTVLAASSSRLRTYQQSPPVSRSHEFSNVFKWCFYLLQILVFSRLMLLLITNEPTKRNIWFLLVAMTTLLISTARWGWFSLLVWHNIWIVPKARLWRANEISWNYVCLLLLAAVSSLLSSSSGERGWVVLSVVPGWWRDTGSWEGTVEEGTRAEIGWRLSLWQQLFSIYRKVSGYYIA